MSCALTVEAFSLGRGRVVWKARRALVVVEVATDLSRHERH